MGAMKRTILLLSVLVTLAGTAPASGAFLGVNPRLGQSFLNTSIEQVAGDVSREGLPGFGGAWLRGASEFFVAPGARVPSNPYNVSTQGMSAAERQAVIEYAQRTNAWLAENGPTRVCEVRVRL
jgi:hypothetical protein